MNIMKAKTTAPKLLNATEKQKTNIDTFLSKKFIRWCTRKRRRGYAT